MKKILLTVTILSLSLSAYCQNELGTAAQISFGRYGSDCSSGRGSCSFTASKPGIGIFPKNARKISKNSFQLEIDKKSLTKEEQVRIFGMPLSEINPEEIEFFLQEEALLLSKETLQNLKIDTQYAEILSGNYSMTLTRDTIKIVFTLSDPNVNH